jgi:two-component system CheB/CheR fusion protein
MTGRIAAYRDQAHSDEPWTQAGETEDQLRDVLVNLRARTGHDFTNYKLATVQRRVARRMSIIGVTDVADYAQILREQSPEAAALMQELLISVTSFFRDPEAFSRLEHAAIPRIFDGKRRLDQVRAWVAGCATGEEAYSIAMLLAEAASERAEAPTVQLFATDLDRRAIAVAREGLYSDADVADVSEERVHRFFQKEPAGYRIRRELRETVLFAEHNLIKDPPFSHLDLVASRNLLIYLNRTIQGRVIETFHFALRRGGYLFLGASESPEGWGDLFTVVDKDARLYESRTDGRPPAMPPMDPVSPFQERLSPPPGPSPVRPSERLLPADLHQRLLEQYAAPSLLISEEHDIVHLSERAGEYLQVTGGEPSRNLIKLARPELRGDLRAALYRAGRERASVEVRGVSVSGPGPARRIDITVRPVLRDGDPARGYFLVIFADGTAPPEGAAPLQLAPSQPVAEHLEDELVRLRSLLRTTIEQYETQVEEAKAANEELQAMNEELRSAAEELETSKEELQSVNEELTTVNQELKVNIDELALANNDFQNLINSTNLGTIFLDRSLRVKMSTPGAQDIFNLLPSDSGRPLTDLTSSLIYQGLHDDIREVVNRLQTIEREVETGKGQWFLMRIFPYRTVDDRIDGVVLTFLDITERRAAATKMRGSEERFRLLVASAIDYAIFTMDLDGIVDSWNPGAERMFGYTSDEILGSSSQILFTPEDRAAGVPALEIGKAMADGRADDERWHLRKDGSRLYCSGVTTRLGGEAPVGLAKIARDLTAQQQAARDLEDAHAALDSKVRERTSALESEVALHAAAELHVTRLMRNLVTSQEDQRARIARDLHDHLGQQLTALRLTLERHRDRCQPQTRADVEGAIAQTKKIDDEIDFLAWELRPAVLDDLGLAVALPRYVAEWSQHYGVAAECHATGFARERVTPAAEVTFYRIAQEALNNVLKHAHASQVNVILETHDGLATLVVEDDGIGFDPGEAMTDERGLGLAGMRERAALIGASLQIESTPTQGTTIFVRCPAKGQAKK